MDQQGECSLIMLEHCPMYNCNEGKIITMERGLFDLVHSNDLDYNGEYTKWRNRKITSNLKYVV